MFGKSLIFICSKSRLVHREEQKIITRGPGGSIVLTWGNIRLDYADLKPSNIECRGHVLFLHIFFSVNLLRIYNIVLSLSRPLSSGSGGGGGWVRGVQGTPCSSVCPLKNFLKRISLQVLLTLIFYTFIHQNKCCIWPIDLDLEL